MDNWAAVLGGFFGGEGADSHAYPYLRGGGRHGVVVCSSRCCLTGRPPTKNNGKDIHFKSLDLVALISLILDAGPVAFGPRTTNRSTLNRNLCM